MVKIRIKTGFLGVYAVLLIFVLAASAAAQLSISNVDFTSIDKNNEVKPNENATISFEVDNDADDTKIEDIKTTTYFERNGKKMKDDNGDEIKYESDIDYIKAGKSKDVKFSFTVPFDVDSDQVYDVVIEVEGRNASNRQQKFPDTDRSESFMIVKDRHDLLFYKLDISPITISCSRDLYVHYDIRNIGEEDEEGNLSIINSLFGINFSEDYSLDSNYDEDNKLENTKDFLVKSGIAPGVYPLTLTLYYDNGMKTKYNTTQITVQDCSQTGAQIGTQTGANIQTGTGTQIGTQTGIQTGQQQNVQPQQPPITYYSAAQPKKSSIDQTTILVVAGVIILVLFIVVIVLVIGRRR